MKNKTKIADSKSTSFIVSIANNTFHSRIMPRLYTTEKNPSQEIDDRTEKQTIDAVGQLDHESMAEFNGELTN